MKRYWLTVCLAVLPLELPAQQADPCATLAGSALDRCRADQQKVQRQQLTQQEQQLTQLQQQLAQQQQQLAQQQDQLRHQQEQLAQQQQQIAAQQEQSSQNEKLAKQVAASAATRDLKPAEVKSWKADNPWYGSDYARTQFAVRYARQLQQERPDLIGRPFLDAISAKVRDTFGAYQ
jgi:TolA-binding protein